MRIAFFLASLLLAIITPVHALTADQYGTYTGTAKIKYYDRVTGAKRVSKVPIILTIGEADAHWLTIPGPGTMNWQSVGLGVNDVSIRFITIDMSFVIHMVLHFKGTSIKGLCLIDKGGPAEMGEGKFRLKKTL
jgi:hypothetical protein